MLFVELSLCVGNIDLKFANESEFNELLEFKPINFNGKSLYKLKEITNQTYISIEGKNGTTTNCRYENNTYVCAKNNITESEYMIRGYYSSVDGYNSIDHNSKFYLSNLRYFNMECRRRWFKNIMGWVK